MSSMVKLAKRIIVSIIGFPLLAVGIVLVPLPGPGLLVMFVALILLATEFEWANRYAVTTRSKLKELYDKAKTRADSDKQ